MGIKTLKSAQFIHEELALYSGTTKADCFGRAAQLGTDAFIIDLEDAVAPSDKQKARTAALQ
jgi:citrate lyase beta subunit